MIPRPPQRKVVLRACSWVSLFCVFFWDRLYVTLAGLKIKQPKSSEFYMCHHAQLSKFLKKVLNFVLYWGVYVTDTIGHSLYLSCPSLTNLSKMHVWTICPVFLWPCDYRIKLWVTFTSLKLHCRDQLWIKSRSLLRGGNFRIFILIYLFILVGDRGIKLAFIFFSFNGISLLCVKDGKCQICGALYSEFLFCWATVTWQWMKSLVFQQK